MVLTFFKSIQIDFQVSAPEAPFEDYGAPSLMSSESIGVHKVGMEVPSIFIHGAFFCETEVVVNIVSLTEYREELGDPESTTLRKQICK